MELITTLGDILILFQGIRACSSLELWSHLVFVVLAEYGTDRYSNSRDSGVLECFMTEIPHPN